MAKHMNTLSKIDVGWFKIHLQEINKHYESNFQHDSPSLIQDLSTCFVLFNNEAEFLLSVNGIFTGDPLEVYCNLGYAKELNGKIVLLVDEKAIIT